MSKGTIKNILVVNGPNLNMLGRRQPEIYGRDTLQDIERNMTVRASELGYKVECRQSNSEGDLVGLIQAACSKTGCEGGGKYCALILNAGAYSHTSIAIADAVQMIDIPVIEVHLSNIFAREKFRHHSYISPIANGVICGFGTTGYILALEAVHDMLS